MKQDATPQKQALYKAAEVIGGQAALAFALGYKDRRNVQAWFLTERQFPAHLCPKVERATREKGTPVTCEELRPDVDWSYLREPVAA